MEPLRPYLAVRDGLAQAQGHVDRLARLVEARIGAVVLLDGFSRWAYASDHAQELFERYFGCADGCLPRPVNAWLRSQRREPFVVAAGRQTLVVRAVDDVLVLEEQPVTRRLTVREREILDLVAEGKTNAQVADELCIAGGTVRRHLENAYAKLGVHTRTAAVRAVASLS